MCHFIHIHVPNFVNVTLITHRKWTSLIWKSSELHKSWQLRVCHHSSSAGWRAGPISVSINMKIIKLLHDELWIMWRQADYETRYTILNTTYIWQSFFCTIEQLYLITQSDRLTDVNMASDWSMSNVSPAPLLLREMH